MFVELTPVEQRLAEYIAKQRHARNRAAGVEDAKIGPQGAFMTDLQGIGAELAFCKIHNCYPDLQIDQRPEADAYTTRHGAVDVKATQYQGGRLVVRPTKAAMAPDAYALMVGTYPRFRFVGWVTADELFQDSNLRDLGHGPTYAIDQKDLRT